MPSAATTGGFWRETRLQDKVESDVLDAGLRSSSVSSATTKTVPVPQDAPRPASAVKTIHDWTKAATKVLNNLANGFFIFSGRLVFFNYDLT